MKKFEEGKIYKVLDGHELIKVVRRTETRITVTFVQSTDGTPYGDLMVKKPLINSVSDCERIWLPIGICGMTFYANKEVK